MDGKECPTSIKRCIMLQTSNPAGKIQRPDGGLPSAIWSVRRRQPPAVRKRECKAARRRPSGGKWSACHGGPTEGRFHIGESTGPQGVQPHPPSHATAHGGRQGSWGWKPHLAHMGLVQTDFWVPPNALKLPATASTKLITVKMP